MIFISPKLEVKKSPIHGLGVFAKDFIQKDEVFETSHFWVLNETDFGKIDPTIKEISFAWPMFTNESHAVVLGWASIYNHSDDNNAAWTTDVEGRFFKFYAVKDIQPGEEICTNYMRTNYMTIK